VMGVDRIVHAFDALDGRRLWSYQRPGEALTLAQPGVLTIAEESTSWPGVSLPAYDEGPRTSLGFGFKWNMGFMHDTLQYMQRDPVHRKHHHGEITFGLTYAFSENFVLPLSHDEVVHGKGSLFGKMAGDQWQKFANLRAYYGFMFTQPGKKLLFMGDEFAQSAEWNHDLSLDWHLLQYKEHRGVQALVRDLNHVYRTRKELHESDCDGAGFAWIDCSDSEASVLSYIRRGADPDRFVIVVCNFTPIVRSNYRVGVPRSGTYREILNTDSAHYGGSNVGNAGAIAADGAPMHGHDQSLAMTLPPLATLIFEPI